MSVSLVARRYATALYQLGNETGALEALTGEVDRMAAAYSASAELRGALENPLVAHASKRAVVEEIAERLSVSTLTKNALAMLVDRRRIKTLPLIASALRELADREKGVLRAEVSSAAPLSDAYCTKLREQLQRITGKQVLIERTENPALIAGVVTRIGDRVLDGSLRTRLLTLKDALAPSAS
jgi:F-type H+-transporting ATPase subunit delta